MTEDRVARRWLVNRLLASVALVAPIIAVTTRAAKAANILFENTLFLSETPGATTKRTPAARAADIINVKDFGAIGDGSGALLNTRYGSLAAAQAVYPFVTNIATQTIDWAAIQAAIKWTGTTTPVGCVFFPYGTYVVADPINFGSDITLSVCFLGVGVGSTIQTINAGLPGQALLSRAAGTTNQTSIITIEQLEIVNYGVLGCAIELGVSSLGASLRDLYIHADIGISCGEFVNPTQVTSAATTSGTTLTFAAGVPQRVIDNFNNGHGASVAVSNVTTPNSTSVGTTVAGVTSTTVTLSGPVAGTVGNGDTIQFTWTQQESVRGAWQVRADRIHCEAHHDYIPGSFGIAIIENSVLTSIDMNTYDHGIRVCGVGNVIEAPHIETCRKAIVLGMMPNGVAQTGSSFKISALGAESNGVGIDCVSDAGVGVIEGGGMHVANFAVPYTGNPISGVAVTGSISGATGTAAVAYSIPHAQWEMTLTSVSGTFQVGDNLGDGTNIPKFTAIQAFVSGSGGSGTVCGPLSGQGEYGLHGATHLRNVVVEGVSYSGFYNQAAIDFEGGDGGANVKFTSCNALNNMAGRPAWITPSIAGDAKYECCNLDQPEYPFNNLRPYPFAQRGDEFLVTNSSVSSFNGTVDGAGGAGANHVKAVATKIVTGVTNAGTSVGSPTINFASTPSGIVNGMVIGSSGRITTGLQPFPVGTTVIGQTGTTVTASANATAAVLIGDTIGFVQWTVH